MANVSPTVGIVRNGPPSSARRTLPFAPGGGEFLAMLADLTALLKSAFQAPMGNAQGSDPFASVPAPRESGRTVDPFSAPAVSPADPEAPVREGLRRNFEERFEEVGPGQTEAALDEASRWATRLESKGMVGQPEGEPGTVVDDLVHTFQNWTKQPSVAPPVTPEVSAPPVAPVPLETPPAVSDQPSEESPVTYRPPAVPAVETITPENVEGGTESAPEPVLATPSPMQVEAMLQAPVAVSLAAAPVAAEGVSAEGGSKASPSALRAVEVSAPGSRAADGVPVEARPIGTPRSQARVEFVERILRAAKLTATQGQTKLRIVLQPAHLGGLKVTLTLKDHVLHGTIQAEQSAARAQIESQLPALRQSLEEQGVRVGELQVNVDQGYERTAQERREAAERNTLPWQASDAAVPETSEPSFWGDPANRGSWRDQVVDLVA